MSAIRAIIFRRSASVPLTVTIKRDISTVKFDNIDTYKKQPKKRQNVVDKVVSFAKVSGLDAGGADAASIPGGFHSGGKGTDTFSRVTATIKDRSGQQLYFFRTTDKSFWERVHIPEDNKNSAVWPSKPIYIHISKADFDSKKKPAGH